MSKKPTSSDEKKSAQPDSASKAVSLSMLVGLAVFGIYLAWDLYSSPETKGVSIILLIVSLIALGLTVLNVALVSKPKEKNKPHSKIRHLRKAGAGAASEDETLISGAGHRSAAGRQSR